MKLPRCCAEQDRRWPEIRRLCCTTTGRRSQDDLARTCAFDLLTAGCHGETERANRSPPYM